MITDEKLDLFLKALQEKQDQRMDESYPSLNKPRYYAERGSRYIRIVRDENGGSRSAFCFIDSQNGDILKAAGWKAPAKHARGNIMTDTHGIERLGPYGPAYLR